jgi:hypothetical protein
MKRNYWLIPVCLLLITFTTKAQPGVVDSLKFFTDEKLIDLTLTTDIRKLQTEKKLDIYQDATVSFHFPDSTVIDETITVAARGHFRRENCNIPPMSLNFRNLTSPRLSSLGKLKLVMGCGTNSEDEQLLLKEYLIYKIYNLLEKKSFLVRLVKVNYRDSKNKMKPYSQYAFLIEDDNDMARRNGCKTKAKAQYQTENTNREQMTMVGVFEYMISNGDWSVPNNHNTKLIYEKKNDAALPYVVPYDFDHSGFVNAGYAVPNELLGTEKVTERVYRGFGRTMEELESTFEIYRKQKDNITSLIMNFPFLKDRTKKEAVDYLNEFYKTINDKRQVKSEFIDNARKN